MSDQTLTEPRSEPEYNDAVRLWLAIGEDLYWLGGNDLDEEGTWVWASDGEAVPDEIWPPGEPNNHLDREDCMIMVGTELHDYSCAAVLPLPYVCYES